MRDKDLKKLKHGGRKHIPLPTGPYSVGCVDVMTGYSKEGSFMRLFYPCTKDANTLEKQLQWPTWLPHENYLNGYANFLKVPKPLFRLSFRFIIGEVYIPAIWDAEPLQRLNGDKLPVVVFSHGVASCRTTYTTICLELASQGYIVAAVEHRDESACHTFTLRKDQAEENAYKIENDDVETDDGYHYPTSWTEDDENRIPNSQNPTREWLNYDNRSLSRREYPARRQQLQQRTEECVKILDLLQFLNDGVKVENVLDPFFKGERFKDTMDLSKVSIAGHSFGAATVIHAMSIDLRFKLGLCLDTWMLPLMKDDDVLAMVTQPILFVNMEKFQTKRNLRLLSKLEVADVERKVVTIKGCVHLDQCDMAFVCGWLEYKFLTGFSRVNRFTAVDTTTRFMLDFLAKHLGAKQDSQWEEYLKSQEKRLIMGIKPKLRTPLNPTFNSL